MSTGVKGIIMKKKSDAINNHQEQDAQEMKEQPNEQDAAQLNELTDTLKRVQAEFENYKKRCDKENAVIIKNSNAQLIKQLLPVLDSFELAIKNNTENGNNPEIAKFIKGLELIYAQFFDILESQGLRIIDTKNKKFDPYKHEVLLVQESDQEDDSILQEFQKGYMLNDGVLRHSKVMISRKRTAEQYQGAKDG